MTGVAKARGKGKKSLDLIDQAVAILREIQPCSVRAVCYRLFAAGAIPFMKKSETDKVSRQLTWAREQNIVPWSWIVDETREAETISSWNDPTSYLSTCRRAYRKDRWATQPHWVEIWSEKGTIRGTLKPILDDYGLTFRVMHGYGSSTAVHQVAEETQQADRRLTVLYVGDWDPSGLHMSQVDLPRRLARYQGWVQINRIALDETDIRSGLSSFPLESKRLDPRYKWYRDQFGASCFELDALSPNLLRERVVDAVRQRLDVDLWQQSDVAERAEHESMQTFFASWPLSKSRRAANCEGV